MSRFFYRVRNASGKILQDYISASSVADAAIKLEKKGCIVLEIKEDKKDVNNFNFSNHAKLCILTLSEKKEFFNSFYFLYKSGLSIFEIFKSICNSSKNQAIIGLCRQVIKGVEKGKSLKESMKSCSNALGIAYTTLISTGEEAGKLEENLLSILKNVTRQEEIKSNLISSLTYPVSIFFLAIAVGLIFKFFVFEIFSQRTQGNTYVNIAGIASAAIIKILIIFAIIFTVIFFVYKNKNLRNSIIKFILNIGIFGKLLKNYNLLNFFSILAMAYDSGIPVSESIMLANSVINIPNIHTKIKKSEAMVLNGCETATALGITGLFSNHDISQISSGEKAGELDKIFKIIVHDYENRLDTSIKIILKLVEPVMIIIVGIFVCIIAVNGYKAYYNSILSMF